MKRITFLTVMLLATVVVFGQTIIEPNYSAKPYAKSNYAGVTKPTSEIIPSTSAKATIFEENFEGAGTTWPPTGWTVIDGIASDEHWLFSNDSENGGNGTGQARVLYDPNYTQDEWLITPTISIPATGTYLFQFDWSMFYDWMVSPNENGDCTIKVSTDGGTNWTAIWIEDDQALVESPVIPWPWETYEWYTTQLDLSTAYAGQDIIIGFHYEAFDAARVQIDNVMVYEAFDDELVLNTPYTWFNMGGGWLTSQPIDQLVGVFFGAHLWNNGINDANNVVLSANIDNAGGSIYYQEKDTVILSATMQDSLGIDTGFVDYLVGPYEQYDLTLECYSDATEPNMDNNTFEASFYTSANKYQRWYEYTNGIGAQFFTDGADGDFLGCRYYIPNNDTLYSVRVFIDPMTNPGTTIIPRIFQSTDTEVLDLITGDEYDIQASDLGNWVELVLPDLTGSDLLVDGDYVYYAGVDCYFGTDTLMIGADAIGAPHDYRYESVLFQSGTDWYYIHYAPMIELITGTFDSSPEVTISNDNVNIYPNPTEGILNFENVENTNITVYNMLGMVVAQVNNANDLTTIDISDMEDGTYIVKVENNSNVVTKKIILTK